MPIQDFKVGEMINKRTKNTKTWINFDGSYTVEIHGGDVHFDDENGNFHNINTDLVDEMDLDSIDIPVAREGKERFKKMKEKMKEDKKKKSLDRDLYDFQGLFVPFDCHIPRNFKRGYTIGKGSDKLTFKPVGSSPSKGYVDEQNKNQIHYQDAWNDTDVVLEIKQSGIKETMYLKTDRAPISFSFEVIGDLADDLTCGEMFLSPAWLQDANGEKRDVIQNVRREGDQTFIDLLADVSGLTYPIELDPTVTINTGKDTYIHTSQEASHGTENMLQVGCNSTGGVTMTLLDFPITSIPAGSVINSANVYMYLRGTSSYSGSNPATYSYPFRLIQAWAEGNSGPPSSVSDNDPSGGVLTLSSAEGWRTYTVTNIIRNAMSGSTYYGIGIKGGPVAGYSQGNWYFNSREFGGGTIPYLSVSYNTPPTAPNVTAPNGGETWNSSHTVTWNPSTDADTAQSSLSYQVELSTNNGSTWKLIFEGMNVTSCNYDFINESETSTAKIRVRAYDGASYSPWDESNGVFTIQHNQAPTAPTNLSPTTVKDRAQTVRFAWQHNDSVGDPQSKFDLDWRIQGNATWNAIAQTSVNNYYDMTGGTLPKGTIEWRVRTYDQAGVVSPYSAITTFVSGDKPANPTITSPTNGSTVSIARPTIQWSSVDQNGYHLKVMDGTTLVWESIVTSANKAVTVGVDLTNGKSYSIQLAVKNADGIYSNFVSNTITVSYTQPAKPIVSVTNDADRGSISLDIINLTPQGTTPNVSKMDIFKKINGEFVRIAKDFIAGEAYSKTAQLTANFLNKVSGSTVENPHIVKVRTGSLGNPTIGDYGELTNIDNIKILDSLIRSTSTATNGTYAQHLFSFDLIQKIERQLGFKIPADTVANKVVWLKAFITKLLANWHGFGSGPLGNKGSFNIWSVQFSSWTNYSTLTHTNSTVSKLSKSVSDSINVIDTGGFVHFLAYAEPSNGTIASTINTDYVELITDITYTGKKGTFTDHTPKYNQTEEYFVRVYGENGTFIDSDIVSGSTTFQSAQLALTTDFDVWLKVKTGAKRNKGRTIERSMAKFAGRAYFMAEYSEHEEWMAGLSFMIMDPDELDVLDQLVESRETILYRDNHGKREFVSVSGYDVEDHPSGWWNVNLKVEKVYFVEVV